MAMLPVRRDPAPLAVRTATRAHASAPPAAAANAGPEPALDDRIGAAVDAAVAEALAKVSTPADQALAKQQAAFDRMMALKAEQQREANVIRDMAMEQLKADEEVLKKWIEMI
jgi:hypothetical protein